MDITFNGEQRTVAEEATVAELVPRVGGLAVAVNGVVVPATAWSRTRLAERDEVEVVSAQQGG